MRKRFAPFREDPRGFSLLEMLVAMVVFVVILLAVFSIIEQTQGAWKNARSSTEAFQGARLAFEQITRTLGEATLNTHYDYFDAAGRTPREEGYAGPRRYGRQSDLHFISGAGLVPGQVGQAVFFQTPKGYTVRSDLQGRDALLNACGFFVVHEADRTRPAFLDAGGGPPNPVRYRLMQFLQPSENLAIYAGGSARDWFTTPLSEDFPPVEQLAENVVALVVSPRRSAFDGTDSPALTADFAYDSRKTGGAVGQLPTEHQLPPVVDVVLVAIDDGSAQRLGGSVLTLPGGLLQDPSRLEADLKDLEAELTRQNLRYRVFRATVAIRGAKWSV